MWPPGRGPTGGLAVRETLSGTLIPALAPAGSSCSEIWQYPRYIAKKRGSVVTITCYLKCQGNVTWLLDSEVLKQEERHIIENQNHSNATLIIKDIQPQDSGIYLCQQTHTDGPCGKGCGSILRSCGTELHVTGGFGA